MRFLMLAMCAAATAAGAQSYTLQLQARTNLIVNDNGFNLPPGASFNSISAHLNDARQLTFRVQVVPGTNAEGIWFGADGQGQLVCFGENNSDAILSDPRINGLGLIVYKQSFSTINGVYRCDPAIPSSTPVTTGPLGTTDWGSPDHNDAGEIGYRAGYSGPQAWVSRSAGGQFSVHVADLNADVGSPYDFLFSPAFSPDRRLVGVLRRAAANGNPQSTELRIVATDGSSTLIARDRTADPASAISSFDSTAPAVNANGQVAFLANLFGGGRAVFRGNGGALVEIARVGSHGVTTLDVFGPAIDAQNRVVFRGRDSNGRALFVGDATSVRRILGTGDRVATDLGLAQFGQNDTSEVFSGRPNVNAAGDIAFVAALHPDGNNQIEWGSGVFIARIDRDNVFANGFE